MKRREWREPVLFPEDESLGYVESPLPRHRVPLRWCDACGHESVGSICDRCDDTTGRELW